MLNINSILFSFFRREWIVVNARLNSPDDIYRHEKAFIYKGAAVYPWSRQNRNVTRGLWNSWGTEKWYRKQGQCVKDLHKIVEIKICHTRLESYGSQLQFGTKLSRFEGSYQPSEFWWYGGTETCHWSESLSYLSSMITTGMISIIHYFISYPCRLREGLQSSRVERTIKWVLSANS